MSIVKRLCYALFFITAITFLTSAMPSSKARISPEKIKAATLALDLAAKDGKVTYTELKNIATDLKGSKLTFKERLGLKIFNKRISSKATSSPFSGGGKSQVIALILCALVGGLGIHRFYLGYTWQGIVQLLTLGGCGIWALIDLIRIITGSLQPKDGEYETTL
ncbi:MAG TPA: TM2 domain-containing protein [Chitinophagaceae bacterium]|nr:TM2 domain-containing protein [Chitinophagaceae bacterium]